MDYQQQKEAFTREVLKFHQLNGNPVKRIPLLGGKELDLYHLYTKVQSLGGSARVTEERLWGEIARSFNLPPSVTSASYACRQNYIKLLEDYEKSQEDPNYVVPQKVQAAPPPPPPPKQSGFSSKDLLLVLSVLQKLSNYGSVVGHLDLAQSLNRVDKLPSLADKVAALNRIAQELSPDQIKLLKNIHTYITKRKPSEKIQPQFSWLTCCLLSDLPNEVDFAVNVLLKISEENCRIFPPAVVSRLVDVLLSHVGLYAEEAISVICFKEHQQDFWKDCTPKWVCLSVFPHDGAKGPLTGLLFPAKFLSWKQKVLKLRLFQVAEFIRNVLSEKSNAKVLAGNNTIIRFILLAINSTSPCIKAVGFEILTKISRHLVVGESSSYLMRLLMDSLFLCVLSSDKCSIVCGMEVMHQLIWCLHVPLFLIHRLEQLLLVPDTEIVLCSLVTLYSAALGGNIPTHSNTLVMTLVQLVTSYWSDLDFEAVQDTCDHDDDEVSATSESLSSSACISSTIKTFYKLLHVAAPPNVHVPSLHHSSVNDKYRIHTSLVDEDSDVNMIDNDSNLIQTIGLIAILILQNLLPNNMECIKPFESRIMQVACSNTEARTIAVECLALLTSNGSKQQ